jgi:hypothetical protein
MDQVQQIYQNIPVYLDATYYGIIYQNVGSSPSLPERLTDEM